MQNKLKNHKAYIANLAKEMAAEISRLQERLEKGSNQVLHSAETISKLASKIERSAYLISHLEE